MTIRNLEHAVRPASVAVIGGSVREGSVGQVVMRNVVEGGFEGQIWAVNPKYRDVQGRPCFHRVRDLPAAPDLGVVVTPAAAVPGVVSDLAEKGTRAAVVLTAGLTDANGLKQAMLDAAKPSVFRIIGPNSLGLLVPPAKLNASFAHIAPASGNIALLSQSGAIAASLIDWAADQDLGFSHVVSLGDMADVDVGDWLDMLAGDARAQTILMYLETIPNARKFMSAARAAARIKPVIVVKSGRHEQAAKAAATHTGALSGTDRVVDAALRRAGLLRVKGLTELFDAAETTARFAPLDRARVGIVTNGGGAGVLALDQLFDSGGEMGELSEQTLHALGKMLPCTWSKANPVDIIGDAPPQRYRDAVRTVAKDSGVDAVMVLACPTGLSSSVSAARAIADVAVKGRVEGKPVLTCWLGEHTARAGRGILQEAGVASFETPADAAAAVSYLSDWSRSQRALTRVPSGRGGEQTHDRAAALAIFRQVAGEGRRLLTEPEAKAVIAAYGISVPETVTVKSPEAARKAAAKLLKCADSIVVKLLSKAITHKSDVGGVVLDIRTAAAAADAAASIRNNVRKKMPDAPMDGFTLQPMVRRPHAQELILGISSDPIFGPVLLFGAGGVAVEIVDDIAMGLPPLDEVLAGDLVDQTRVVRLLAGFRGRKAADSLAITRALLGLSQMVVDFPCIVAMDINPLLADADGVIALDARVEIDPAAVDVPGPNPALAIRPYPAEWETDLSTDKGGHYRVRPIRPADMALYPDFLAKVSPDDVRLRFIAPRRHFPDAMLKRLTQLDYDRDMAFVALGKDSGALAAVGRLSSDPDRSSAEYALLVRTDLQGQGLGWALLQHLIDYARAEKIGRIEGLILSDNSRMLTMCSEFGFSIRHEPGEAGLVHAALELG